MYDGSGSYRSSYLSVSAGRPGLSMPAVVSGWVYSGWALVSRSLQTVYT
jgi:hypothetical protein